MPDATISDLVLKSLICPRCRVAVELCKTGDLCCTQCNATFPVREGLPIMLFDDSRLFQRFSVTGDVTLEALDSKGQPRDLAPVQGELATMSRAGFALICHCSRRRSTLALSPTPQIRS